jgi:hypothetical protein
MFNDLRWKVVAPDVDIGVAPDVDIGGIIFITGRCKIYYYNIVVTASQKNVCNLGSKIECKCCISCRDM